MKSSTLKGQVKCVILWHLIAFEKAEKALQYLRFSGESNYECLTQERHRSRQHHIIIIYNIRADPHGG